MAGDSYSKLPSGLMARGKDSGKSEAAGTNSAAPSNSSNGFSEEGPNWALILAVLALLLAGASLYLSLSNASGLGANERAQLRAITSDLRAIQEKQITLSSPLRTTVFVEKTFPVSDILPDHFNIPLDFTYPINASLTAQSNTGQIVPLRVDDTLKVHTSVPIDVNKAMSGVKVTINKEIPIDTRFSVDLKVSAVYGKELNDLINRLDALSAEPGSAASSPAVNGTQ